jgi:NADH:ubiquinone oxidoreductase subunit 6 (subunit J)
MRRAVVKALAVGLLALLFVLAVTEATWPEGDMDHVTNEELGEELFGTSGEDGPAVEGYGLAFFLVGLLLLVAMLGGVFLAKEEGDE